MDATLLLIGAVGLLALGFLVGWVLNWRYEHAYWSKQMSDLLRRELVNRTRAAEELAAARAKAEQDLESLRAEMERQMAEVRSHAEEQVSAAYAKCERTIAAVKRDYEARGATLVEEYERGLANARAAYRPPSATDRSDSNYLPA